MRTLPSPTLGPLEITDSTRELLSRVWNARQAKGCSFPPVVVSDAEAALGSLIPNEILAIFIAEGRSLHDAIALTNEVTEYYEASNADVRFPLIAFARFVGDESEPTYACFGKAKQRAEVELVEWDLKHPTLPDGKPLALADYVERRWAALLGREANAKPPATFAPTLEDPPKPPAARVKHAKFGEGVVVQDHGDGKLTILFGDHGEKKLAKSFVVPLE